MSISQLDEFFWSKTFWKIEKRDDRSDLSDDSDFSNYSDCDIDETYWERYDDHVTRRSRKRWELLMRFFIVNTVIFAACAKDSFSTAVINNMKSWNSKKYRKMSISNFLVFAVTVDETMTNCSDDDDILVSDFLSSYLSEFKVCYTITFYHQEIDQL